MNVTLRTVDLLVHNAEIDGRRADLAIDKATIVGVSPPSGGPPARDVFDACGGAVIPGLHDHHMHLLALAAARQSLTFTPAFDSTICQAVSNTPPGTWIRAIGYHESMVGEIDRQWLDARVPDRPIRVQHRSGAMWVLNSAALAAADIDSPDGRLFGDDEALRGRVPPTPLDLAAVGKELAGYGVTGVSDLTPTTDAGELDLLGAAVLRQTFPVEVMITGGLDLEAGATASLRRGPIKIVVGDYRLPSLDALIDAFARAHRRRRAVAVHCVTRVGLLLALAAWQETGTHPGDRIEHGAVIPLDVIPTIAQLGLTVVTQPSFVAERGDQYLAEVDAGDVDSLWRCGSLIAAGIPVGASTDAPFGHPDPWRAVVAATRRLTPSGAVLGAGERIGAGRALQAFHSSPLDPGGAPRRIRPGQPAELCILHTTLADMLDSPSSNAVAATYGRAGLTIAGSSK